MVYLTVEWKADLKVGSSVELKADMSDDLMVGVTVEQRVDLMADLTADSMVDSTAAEMDASKAVKRVHMMAVPKVRN